SSALTVWLTADWVTLLIWAALVKLLVSLRSQKTFNDSNCMSALDLKCGRSQCFTNDQLLAFHTPWDSVLLLRFGGLRVVLAWGGLARLEYQSDKQKTLRLLL